MARTPHTQKKSSESSQSKKDVTEHSDSESSKEKRTRKLSNTTRAKNEIKKQQDKTDRCITRGAFIRILKDSLRRQGADEDIRVSKQAAMLAQCVTEDVNIDLLSTGNYNKDMCTKFKRMGFDTVDLMSAVHGDKNIRAIADSWLKKTRIEIIRQKIARKEERERVKKLTDEERVAEREAKKKIEDEQKAKRKREREVKKVERDAKKAENEAKKRQKEEEEKTKSKNKSSTSEENEDESDKEVEEEKTLSKKRKPTSEPSHADENQENGDKVSEETSTRKSSRKKHGGKHIQSRDMETATV